MIALTQNMSDKIRVKFTTEISRKYVYSIWRRNTGNLTCFALFWIQSEYVRMNALNLSIRNNFQVTSFDTVYLMIIFIFIDIWNFCIPNFRISLLHSIFVFHCIFAKIRIFFCYVSSVISSLLNSIRNIFHYCLSTESDSQIVMICNFMISWSSFTFTFFMTIF